MSQERKLVVKEWIKTHDDKDTKFLSYTYHAFSDKFSARPKINWAPKKRGTRRHADCKSMAEVKTMVDNFGLTKRSVASILMGTIHDPLGFFLPYLNNLKLIYRDICRQGLKWDQPIDDNMKSRVMEALELFIGIENIQFHRKAIFPESKKVTFKIYLTGSLQAIGVLVVCLSELPNGQKIIAYFAIKAKF